LGIHEGKPSRFKVPDFTKIRTTNRKYVMLYQGFVVNNSGVTCF